MYETYIHDYLSVTALATIAFLAPIIIGFMLSIGFKFLGRGEKIRRNRVFRLIASSINITSFLIGIITCLGTLGVDITALVAGLGLTGLALGLALKDAVSNFIAGLMIILYSPFELGDELEVAGSKGRVSDMDLRYITIESDSEQILIPNGSFLNSVVKRKKGADLSETDEAA